jgi:glycosyltransferase involved in cell wall biosynthesis
VPTVITVHDVYILRNPDAFPPWQRALSAMMFDRMIRRATRVLVDSHYTKHELLNSVGRIDPARVAVVHLGVSPDFRAVGSAEVRARLHRYSLEAPYILSVSTIEPRKNLSRLVQAFAAVANRIPHDLVLAGAPGRDNKTVQSAIEKSGVASRVRVLGAVPQADLPALYAGASLFVYVPLYEGFGLPPLEAMACRAPVLMSTGSALDEVAGPAACRVDATDVMAIAGEIDRILRDETVGSDLRRAGAARAEQFTWERCARETAAVYADAASAG